MDFLATLCMSFLVSVGLLLMIHGCDELEKEKSTAIKGHNYDETEISTNATYRIDPHIFTELEVEIKTDDGRVIRKKLSDVELVYKR